MNFPDDLMTLGPGKGAIADRCQMWHLPRRTFRGHFLLLPSVASRNGPHAALGSKGTTLKPVAHIRCQLFSVLLTAFRKDQRFKLMSWLEGQPPESKFPFRKTSEGLKPLIKEFWKRLLDIRSEGVFFRGFFCLTKHTQASKLSQASVRVKAL